MINEYRQKSDSTASSLQRLQLYIDTLPGQIRSLSTEEFSKRPGPGKWSKKEILGHLIDSATNNHHRFVRAQFENKPTILYNQDEWNAHNYYEKLTADHIITFWELYNRHIIEIIKNTPPDLMQRACTMDDGGTRTIEWLFDDYVRHLEHHVKQIVRT